MRPFRLKSVAPIAVACVVLGGCASDIPEFHTRGLKVPTAQCSVDPSSIGRAERLASFDKSNGCGIPNPWKVHSVRDVELKRSATLNCGMVEALDGWFSQVAQPAAQGAFGERIVGVKVAASYACRARNGRRGSKLSEHGLGNAIDISAFTLVSGRVVEVEDGWSGSRDERGFLRQVNKQSCGPFTTVLGPNHDHAHRNHFHLDLASHGRNGTGTYCR
jgi:hypothetical protein